ncbi:MAG: integrase core domain-containing protein, partial [Bacteroidota bacterium]|nr:integrase core domain-containing protein [Bacteroidota bacterium]
KELAYKAITEAIETYNNLRPHMSLGYMTPNQKCAA